MSCRRGNDAVSLVSAHMRVGVMQAMQRLCGRLQGAMAPSPWISMSIRPWKACLPRKLEAGGRTSCSSRTCDEGFIRSSTKYNWRECLRPKVAPRSLPNRECSPHSQRGIDARRRMATPGAASSAISGTADAGTTPASDGARTGSQRDGHAAARMTTPQRQASGRCGGVPTSMTALQMLSQRCCTGMLSLGCPVLNQCVGGGLPVRGITEVSMPPPLQRSCFSSNLGGSVDRLRGIRELGRPSYACSCCLQYVPPGTRLRNCAMHTVMCCWYVISLTPLVARHSAQLRTVDWDARRLLFTRKGCLLSPG